MHKKDIRISPFKSVNGIEFGTNRADLWKKLGTPKSSFKKVIDDIVDTDNYENFHICYDNNYNFEAIEIICFDGIDVYFDNHKLSFKYPQILEYFKTIYNDIQEDEMGFISKKGSIGVYTDNGENEIDSILFGRKNYYSQL